MLQRIGTKGIAELAHRDRRIDPTPRDITHRQVHDAVRTADDVVPVASHSGVQGPSAVVGRHSHSRTVRKQARQQALLEQDRGVVLLLVPTNTTERLLDLVGVRAQKRHVVTSETVGACEHDRRGAGRTTVAIPQRNAVEGPRPEPAAACLHFDVAFERDRSVCVGDPIGDRNRDIVAELAELRTRPPADSDRERLRRNRVESDDDHPVGVLGAQCLRQRRTDVCHVRGVVERAGQLRPPRDLRAAGAKLATRAPHGPADEQEHEAGGRADQKRLAHERLSGVREDDARRLVEHGRPSRCCRGGVRDDPAGRAVEPRRIDQNAFLRLRQPPDERGVLRFLEISSRHLLPGSIDHLQAPIAEVVPTSVARRLLQDDAPGEHPAQSTARVARRHAHDDEAPLGALSDDRLTDDGLPRRDRVLEVGAIGKTGANRSVRVAGGALPTCQVDPADSGGEAGARPGAEPSEIEAHLLGILRDHRWSCCHRGQRLQLTGEIRVEHGGGENRAFLELLRRVVLRIVVLTRDERESDRDEDDECQQRSEKERSARPRDLPREGILERRAGSSDPAHARGC